MARRTAFSAKAARHGNSVCVVIPSYLVRERGIRIGDDLRVTVSQGDGKASEDRI